MKKLRYTSEEINQLHQQIKNVGSDTDMYSEVVEALASYVLDRYNAEQGEKDDLLNASRIEVHQTLAAQAHQLECEAKNLRALARAFTKPMKELPKDLNHENKIISNIASWRLKLGK